VALVASLALLAPLGAPLAAGRASATIERLRDLLASELQWTRHAIELDRSAQVLERERASLDYAVAVLDRSADRTLRKLGAYRGRADARERVVRARGRSLVKLARGGMVRLLIEGQSDAAGASNRVQRGRTLQWLVRRDLDELAVHRTAEQRQRAELLAATRELDAAASLRMIHGMHARTLDAARHALDPSLDAARQTRQRTLARLDGIDDREARRLLMLVKAARWEHGFSRGLDLERRHGLARPVGGRVVGRFGAYDDPVLDVPMVRHGLELRASRREPVRAVADGRVAFVGRLPGFDEVVVLDHGGGHISLTGRLWAVEVGEGDTVERGDVLGAPAAKTVDDGLGQTVYFELRHGERPIDPEPLLALAG
jgi:murein DD-endopeptidase MepM/ murein hydrolase activator NlpD